MQFSYPIRSLFTVVLVLATMTSTALAENIDNARSAFFSSDYSSAYTAFNELSAKNPAEANYYLGLIASTQSLPYFNLNKAITYFELSAQHGNSQSAQELSQLYYQHADQLDPSYLTAIEWQRVSDQLTLNQSKGMLFYRDSTPITSEEALRNQISQAEQDDTDMQFNLGRRYDFGLGVTQSAEKAIYWYLRSANNGSYTGAIYAAFALCKGLGVEQDTDQANHWLTQINHSARCPKMTGK